MTKIHFKKIDINNITNSSGLHTGVNIQYNRKKRANIAEGFGNINGKLNKISKNVSVSERKNGDIPHG
ncbi:hypothetical protein J7E38_10525 [Bacillus sp. ISL-35]|uniref:hypothetical protein n=1 Tax=Bacillus sp. ISL-35 TaxID=2819122 RepID=UPI001BE70361|nr:hypothetical protein [Bacillus sp. ISL-35]MBT2679437.1 hypothetical protein [Bacillus sp. ISL-35]MBT2703340.1 hypothetical protein [Chryseobacterium sp. ISL-80]